ncbi:unnamed protein product [Gemmataceae bacterium]|nr:unnamed protein product [Gemmataceae bacterium]VTU00116.1 unnamed protein product [Gemmataceae bacterium]
MGRAGHTLNCTTRLARVCRVARRPARVGRRVRHAAAGGVGVVGREVAGVHQLAREPPLPHHQGRVVPVPEVVRVHLLVHLAEPRQLLVHLPREPPLVRDHRVVQGRVPRVRRGPLRPVPGPRVAVPPERVLDPAQGLGRLLALGRVPGAELHPQHEHRLGQRVPHQLAPRAAEPARIGRAAAAQGLQLLGVEAEGACGGGPRPPVGAEVRGAGVHGLHVGGDGGHGNTRGKMWLGEPCVSTHGCAPTPVC